MDPFLKRVEPYFSTNDETVLKIIMRALSDHPGIPDRLTAESLKRSRLEGQYPYISSLNGVILEEGAIEELIKCLQDLHRKHLYQPLLEKMDVMSLIQHKEALRFFITEEAWSHYERIANCSAKDELYSIYSELIQMLDKRFDQKTFQLAKTTVDYIVKKGWLDGEEAVGELEESLKAASDGFRAILNAYILRHFPEDRYVYPLVKALKAGGALLSEAAAETLCAYQTNAIVDEIYPLCKSEDEMLPLSILIKTKTEEALEALRQLYSETKDLEYREAIVEGMCLHFSEDCLHEIEDFIERGQFTGLTDMDDVTYVYYKVVGLDSLSLLLWEDHEEQESS
ncbi:HEAT repeat domain-containing protein [Halobacillus sp. Marseille-Q1614]|uniref:HEAT repeat domain-containing protein n=1 Tax=Halobacillus sp. Marseille-Q1614 TaxID=2709134 RepID=UPI00156E5F97|nr:hypothetical protein [Halobacillus sp. Marseille-Q1614]